MLSHIHTTFSSFSLPVYGTSCPVLECWFVQEKPGRGGGFPAAMIQEKSLLYINTDPESEETKSQQGPSADINHDRVYYVTGQYLSLYTI